MRKYVSLKITIPIFITALVLVAVLGTGIPSLYTSEKKAKSLVLEKNLLISNMIADQIDQYLNNAQGSLQKSAKYLSMNHGLNYTKEELKSIYENHYYFDTVFYLTSEGTLLFSLPYNPDVIRGDFSGRKYFQDVIKTKKTIVGNVIMSAVLGEPHFNVATPILDSRSNELIGIIGSGIPFKNINSIAANAQENFRGKIWVVDENGLIIVHPEQKLLLQPTMLKNVDMVINGNTYTLAELIQKREEGIGQYNLDGRTIFASVSFTNNNSFLVMVEQYENEVLQELYDNQQVVKDLILWILIFSILVGFFIARRITKPIGLLTEGVRKMEKSITNYEDIVITNNDEFGILADSFNMMSLALKNKVNELKVSYQKVEQIQEYLLNILTSAPSGIIVTDVRGEITFCNRVLEEIISMERKEIVGLSIHDLWNKLSLKFTSKLINQLGDGTSCIEREAVITTKYSEEMPISLNMTKVNSKNMQIIGDIYFIKDVTRIKQLEQELNRDDRVRILGEMSAAIIHEVGNPLAGIGNLLEVLHEDLSEQGINKEIVDTLLEEVVRLNKIVMSFLDFTRSTTIEKGPTDLGILVNSVLYLMSVDILYKKVRVIRNYEKGLPRVNIDQTKFKQALINIIKNSVQAVSQEGTVQINISMHKPTREDLCPQITYLEISICDNGIGISKKDLPHIFDPFYTTEKQGTGLGLTIAYKIIKEHNGYIEVISEPQCYTEFKIIIPAE